LKQLEEVQNRRSDAQEEKAKELLEELKKAKELLNEDYNLEGLTFDDLSKRIAAAKLILDRLSKLKFEMSERRCSNSN
jgi:hypothetical protein